MHEYPSTVRIIKIACEHAQRIAGPLAQVQSITVVVGDDSGFVGSSIELYFEMLTEGTPCEGAKLHIERVQPMLECRACGHRFVRKPFSFDCPLCRQLAGPTEVGKEFYIKSILLSEETQPQFIAESDGQLHGSTNI